MYSVIITWHIWSILGQKIVVSSPLLAQFQMIKMPDFTYDILRERVIKD